MISACVSSIILSGIKALERITLRNSWFVLVEWAGEDGAPLSALSAPFEDRVAAAQFAQRFAMESPDTIKTTLLSGVKLDEDLEAERGLTS